jgi:hypothetical protein
VGKLPAGRVSLIGGFRQGAGQRFVYGRVEARQPLSQRRRRRGQLRVHDRKALLTPEWRFPDKQLKGRAR